MPAAGAFPYLTWVQNLRFDNRFVTELPGDPDRSNRRRQVLGAAWSAGSMSAMLAWRVATGFFLAGIYPVGMKIALQPFIMGGMACYAVSLVVWIMALSRVPVSIAYPMLSIGYVVNAVLAYFLFGEAITAAVEGEPPDPGGAIVHRIGPVMAVALANMPSHPA